jgi:hypothetical protein
VQCFRSFSASKAQGLEGVTIDTNASTEPRYQLLTVNGTVLKVTANPSSPGLRREYGKFSAEINITMFADPGKRPPVFAWEEDTRSGKDVLVYRMDDNLLARTSASLLYGKILSSTEVLKCK